jgi:hypothetical protein
LITVSHITHGDALRRAACARAHAFGRDRTPSPDRRHLVTCRPADRHLARDSAENRAHFGGQRGRSGDSGYPLARVVTLMALRTHQLAAVKFGPYSSGETTYARTLWAQVPDNALVVVDRGFWDGSVLFPLADHGANRHWLTRTRANLKWETIEALGPGDAIVEMKPHHDVRARDPSVPKRWRMRAIQYASIQEP